MVMPFLYTNKTSCNLATPHHDNVICLPGSRQGGYVPVPNLAERCVMLMSTYEEFMVLLAVALLIAAILNLKNKQSRSVLVR